jgi:glucose dehydrogenase
MLEGRKVVVQAGKIGWLFVLDAKTGEYIRKSETFVPAENFWEVPVAKMGPWVTPGASGGNNWSPISVDQERKVAFVGAVHQPTRYSREATIGPELARGRDKPQNLGGDWQFDAKGSHGVFSAIDLTSGKILWQNKSPTGETEVYLGGVLSTSTGLVFQGEGDGNLVALDAGNGDVMWKFQTGAGVNAPPIAFELDGEEFIAVASGGSKLWGTPYGHSVFVFGLPKVWTPAK